MVRTRSTTWKPRHRAVTFAASAAAAALVATRTLPQTADTSMMAVMAPEAVAAVCPSADGAACVEDNTNGGDGAEGAKPDTLQEDMDALNSSDILTPERILDQEEDEMESVQKMPRAHYNVHVGAGARNRGELHGRAQGSILGGRDHRLSNWHVDHSYRFSPVAQLAGFQPESRLRVAKKGWKAALRMSKDFLEATNGDSSSNGEPDGSGLDLHVETSIQAPYHHTERSKNGEPVSIEQRAEVVLGPRAQERYLNMSFPVGLMVGAVASAEIDEDGLELGRTASSSSSEGREPVKLYAELKVPGGRPLRGWLAEAEVEDRDVGLVSGQVKQPWTREKKIDGSSAGDEGSWILQHLRTHGTFRLPNFVGDSISAVGSLMSGWGKSNLPLGNGPPPRPAVVPTTKLRAGSNGGGAALGLTSSQNGLGRTGWDGLVEVSRMGWGARLALAAGSSDEGLGQPRYTVTAHSPWEGRTSVSHDLKWVFSDGQWAGVEVKDAGPGRRPRMNFNVEIR
eukprot:TRINITY_DN41909_c0_g1_i1.p1 TRINITY_DN41909_c0_g1~~TRINITY_DN41909_c0_g1_i1.p1  ORF type:complete len:510 (+),score=97.01 TRINITY_DN41909_c0_g1_i1:132-1661(+)